MYRLQVGDYAGKTLAEVMLRDAPYIYRLAFVSEKKQINTEMLVEFKRLRIMLRRARISTLCREEGCKRKAKWVTLPMDTKMHYLASPYYWCDDHGPWEENPRISNKHPIHFNLIKLFAHNKVGQKAIFKDIKEALGIKRGTRITEEMATSFFDDLADRERG
jgi:hypothetical protein